MSTSQSVDKELKILDLKIESVQCEECFYFQQFVNFKFNLTTLNTPYNLFNNLDFTITIFQAPASSSVENEMHFQNLLFSNIRVPEKSSTNGPFFFYFT